MGVGSHLGAEGSHLESPSPEQVREALRRILVSPRFTTSERLRRFLQFVVEEALAGRKDRIKAFTVALEVFGRDQNFDAQNDPLVRIEAGRLRRALDHYYLASGDEVQVVIDIPRGGYVPVFSTRRPRAGSPSVAEAYPSTPDGGAHRAPDAATGHPAILVLPFEPLGMAGSAPYASSLTDEVISALSRFKEVRVLDARAPGTAEKRMAANYVVEGSVRSDGTLLKVSWRLLHAAQGAVLWTASYEVPVAGSDLYRLPSELAGRIATAIAQPYGAVFRSEATRGDFDGEDVEAYLGRLAFYLYRSDLNAERHLALREKLQRLVTRDPHDATAWAMLSYIHIDEDRFGFNRIIGLPGALERAMTCARESVRLDPHNSRGLQALMAALFFTGHPDEALSVGAFARSLNPNDTELTAQIGQFVAMTGRWQEGRSILEKALTLNLGHTGLYHSNLAFTLYMLGDFEAARVEIEGANLVRLPLHNLIATLIYAELGLSDLARAMLETFEAERPDFLPNLGAELSKRNLPLDAQSRIAASLSKIGAAIPLAGAV